MYSTAQQRVSMYSRRILRISAQTLATLVLLVFALQLSACDSANDDEPELDIVEVAVANDFNTLVSAVQAADLTSTLKGDGPFTVFAPTDAAFEALPAGTVETLLQPNNRDQLVSVLTYHIVPGRVTADEVVDLESATTLQGAPLNIETTNGTVRVNGAAVTATDVEASNGVIHVIDGVLLPPSRN